MWIGYQNMYPQYDQMLILSEEPEEEEVGISQVSPVVEYVAEEEEVDFDLDEVKEEDLDMDKVEAEEAVVVAVVVVVEDMEDESITIVTTTMEGRITIMELIHKILQ